MSTKTTFAQMAFPQLRKQESEAENEGYIHGHAAGYTAGLRAADAKYQRRLDELEADFAARREQQQRRIMHTVDVMNMAVAALNARTAPVLAAAENVLVSSALELAEAVLGCELSDTGSAARAALARVVTAGQGQDVVTIRMNPADLSVLTEAELRHAGVDFTADPDLEPGDAVAVLPDGFLDARINTALARAKQMLAEGLR